MYFILDNQSAVPTELLKPLLMFAALGNRYADYAVVVVKDRKKRDTTGGLAKMRGDSPLCTKRHPAEVTLWVRPPEQFRGPRIDAYVKELVPCRVATWEEEVILVAAHEFQHIRQMWGPLIPFVTDSHRAEIDAEAAGIQAVEDWREQYRPRRAA